LQDRGQLQPWPQPPVVMEKPFEESAEEIARKEGKLMACQGDGIPFLFRILLNGHM